jgi:anti-anti-sigma factor
MNIKQQNGTLTVDNLKEISAGQARALRHEIHAARAFGLSHVEIDLSQVNFMDGVGLGALASLYEAVNHQAGKEMPVMRLLHPQPPVQQLLELARMHDVFEIVPANSEAAVPQPAPM